MAPELWIQAQAGTMLQRGPEMCESWDSLRPRDVDEGRIKEMHVAIKVQHGSLATWTCGQVWVRVCESSILQVPVYMRQ